MSPSPIDTVTAAAATCREVMANVTPDQMSAATPCASWDVAGLVNHIVSGPAFWTAALNGESADGLDANWAEGDWMQQFDTHIAHMVESWSADGVMEQMVTMPFGEFPAPAVMGLASTDLFQHAWDLAKATGQSTDLSPQLAEGLLAQAQIPDNFRGPEGAPFGAQKECADDACAADRLAAVLGREV